MQIRSTVRHKHKVIRYQCGFNFYRHIDTEAVSGKAVMDIVKVEHWILYKCIIHNTVTLLDIVKMHET